MSKLRAILPAATVVLLAACGGCATKDDVAALRADVANKDDVAGLRASIEKATATAGAPAPPPPPEYRQLRAAIAALQASIRSAGAIPGAGATATEPVATRGPPPTGYQKVSTLAKLPEFIPGLGALYVQPQTLPAGPFLGYDRNDRLVDTVYMIPVADITARKTFEHLAVGGAPVREVDFYYTPGHPGLEQPHYHVVLWHVPKATADLR
jgi:hypothetical protein